jgi:hypothetical protein
MDLAPAPTGLPAEGRLAKRGAHGGNEGDGDPPGTETGAGIVIDEE